MTVYEVCCLHEGTKDKLHYIIIAHLKNKGKNLYEEVLLTDNFSPIKFELLNSSYVEFRKNIVDDFDKNTRSVKGVYFNYLKRRY